MDEMSFMTSGSTGEPRRIARSLDEMKADAASLAALFGESFSRAAFLAATVPEEHFYGALWRRLLPEALGMPVADGIQTSVEDLSALAERGRFVLVTTPSFLEKAVRHPDFASLKSSVVDVVTSGGALSQGASESAMLAIGVSPLEIYGSTEAGTIAWRRRSVSRLFRFASGVSGHADEGGRLVVESPFAAERPLVMHDAARFADSGEFEILGRTDRLAKVLEKFVSLDAVERAFEAHPFVERARAEAVDVGGVARTGVLAVLSKEGREFLAGSTYEAVMSRLRHDIAPTLSSGAFPRRMRFVAEMPVDARGKTTAAAVRAELPAACHEPVVLSWTATERTLDAELAFPPDGGWFDGHFPESPILPGVVQLIVLRRFALRAFGRFPGVSQWRKVKFRRLVRPGERVRLKVERRDECSLAFEYSVGAKVASSGTVLPQ